MYDGNGSVREGNVFWKSERVNCGRLRRRVAGFWLENLRLFNNVWVMWMNGEIRKERLKQIRAVFREVQCEFNCRVEILCSIVTGTG